MALLDDILKQYGELLSGIDQWYARCQTAYPDEIRCRRGCSECCRGLFDITLTDALYLRQGFIMLSPDTQTVVVARAVKRLESMQSLWPDFASPYILNYRPEEKWEALMPDDDDAPCVLLGEDGRCLVYKHRPMTCRLHGLPLIDPDGTVLHDEWCTLNFADTSPVELSALREDFTWIFEKEVSLFRVLEKELSNNDLKELDTFIPLALLVDLGKFNWKDWGKRFVPADQDRAEI